VVVKRLLLLGGGHAHVHVLQAFARERLRHVELMLVSPQAEQLYSGMVPGLVAGHYGAAQCSMPLAPLAAAAGAQFIVASACGLDAAKRRVGLSDGRSVEYDLLSLDTGAELDRDRLPGAREHGLFVRPMAPFLQRLPGLLQPASARPLDVVVLGGGAAGVELALALQFRLTRADGGGAAARVALVTGGPEPVASHPAGVQRRVARALARRGIVVHREACVALQAGSVVLASGVRLACDVPLIATGAEAPAWLRGSGLALDAQGFVRSGPTLQSRSHPEVFAVGDVATRDDAPHPRSGVYAVRAGPPLARNLRQALTGGVLQPHRPQARALNLIACGEASAIASWGAWSAEGRWVWRWKDRIDRAFIARYVSPTR
jgi:pyridine nucleotide-disulfide oxidoreductase family protein